MFVVKPTSLTPEAFTGIESGRFSDLRISFLQSDFFDKAFPTQVWSVTSEMLVISRIRAKKTYNGCGNSSGFPPDSLNLNSGVHSNIS